MKRLKVGLIGCGAIGTQIAKACLGRLKKKVELAAICDSEIEKARAFKKALKKKFEILDADDLIRRVDLVIEAASAKISAKILARSIELKKSVLIMSVGGLLGKSELLRSAAAKGVRVYIPSGAVSGVDGLKGASMGKIESVTLTTRKPLKGLEGAPYLKRRGIDLGAITKETVLFDGNASEAVDGFPQNINVSAVLSLAGVGPRETRVRIVTSPDYTKNIHEVEVKGDFGRITTKTENVPSPANPKTSILAILSAIAVLEEATGSVRIGT